MRLNALTLPNFRRTLEHFATDTRAATAIEYALIAAGVAVAIASTVFTLGSSVLTKQYNKISEAL